MKLFLKLILGRTLQRFVKKEFTGKTKAIVQDTWNIYSKLENNFPKRKNLGGKLTLSLAGATIAFYQALLKEGITEEKATTLVYGLCLKIYAKMGAIPNIMFDFVPMKKTTRMKLKTNLFRWFPFAPPSYIMEDIASQDSTVKFNVTRCHVAEYFRGQNLSKLCANTWCSLDFTLAKQWGGSLERNSTIADGKKVCDFNWRVL